MMAWVTFHADPVRTIIIGIKKTFVKMLRPVGDEWFMILWHATLLVGWIVCWKQGVEKTMEFAFAYETNVANLHRLFWVPWAWLPQSMSVRRICDGKLFAENLVVGHRRSQESRRTAQRPRGEVY